MKSPNLPLWFKGSVNYLWLAVLAVYLTVSAVQAAVKNYQSQQETKRLEGEVARLEEEKIRLEALVEYYQTDAYREKELRRAFLLKMPGERVYALPESSLEKSQEELASAPTKEAERRNIPTWQQWIDYLLNTNQG